MSTEILLPRLARSMDDGTLAEWLVEDGSRVEAGAPLFALESEKSVQDIEAPAAGRLRILKPAGHSYAVGTVIAAID